VTGKTLQTQSKKLSEPKGVDRLRGNSSSAVWFSEDGKLLSDMGSANALFSIKFNGTAKPYAKLAKPANAEIDGRIPSPDGRLVLVGVYGEDRVAFIDPSTDAVVATVPVAKPHTIAIAPDGRTAYVASQEPGAFALVVVDLATRSVARRLPLTKPPRDLEFAFDGSALYYTQAGVDAVQVLDPRTDAVVAQIPTGASPHIASRYRGAPGGTVVVQGPGEVLLFDPVRNVPMRSIAVGKQPHWIASTGVDGRVVVTNEGSNDVSLVDLAGGTTTRVAVGTAPRKVTVPIAAAATPPVAGRAAAASAPGAGRAVSIRNFAFEPAELRVAPGETVAWTNADGGPHGVAFADGAKGEALMLPGARFERTFAKAGAYDYTCPIHPYMRGRVIVAAP